MIRSLGNFVRWRLRWWIEKRALDWVLQIDAGLTERERAKFDRWFEHPRHQEAFQGAWETVHHTDEVAATLGAQLLQETPPPRRRLSQPLWRWAVAAAATAFVLALGAPFIRTQPAVQVYTTRTAEWRSLSLPDGSEVAINTRTRLEWTPCPGQRCLTLVAGEAYFQVVRDPRRPFVVFLGAHSGVSIRVLGTEFNVHQRVGIQTDITVASGVIKVSNRGVGGIGSWRRELRPNQQLSLGPEGVAAEPHPVAAWRHGLLDVDGDLLPAVVCHLAEYIDHPVYMDKTVLGYRLHARFDVHNIPQALQELDAHLVADRYRGGYWVHERGTPLDSNTPPDQC